MDPCGLFMLQIYIYIYIPLYTHMLHVWNIYQHLPHKWPSFVGKSTSTMEHLGYSHLQFHGLINQLITSYNLGEYHLPGVISLHRSDRIVEVAPTAAPEPQEGRKKSRFFQWITENPWQLQVEFLWISVNWWGCDFTKAMMRVVRVVIHKSLPNFSGSWITWVYLRDV